MRNWICINHSSVYKYDWLYLQRLQAFCWKMFLCWTSCFPRIVRVKRKSVKRWLKQLKQNECPQKSKLCLSSKQLWLSGIFLKAFFECPEKQVLSSVWSRRLFDITQSIRGFRRRFDSCHPKTQKLLPNALASLE